jgi:hypothetical protein
MSMRACTLYRISKSKNNLLVSFPDGGFATTGKETGPPNASAYPNASGGNRVDAEET